MRGPVDVARQLLALDVPHEIVHLPRRVESAQELPGVLGVPESSCVLVDVFETESGYVATLVPCDAVVLPVALAQAIDAQSVRRPELGVVSRVTDFMATLVPPVGLPSAVLVVADGRVAKAGVLYTATGDSWTALKIHGGDLVRASAAMIADLAETGPIPAVRRPVLDSGRVPVGLPLH